MATVVDLVSVDFIMCHVHRGGLKEWPLRQWLTRPSQNEKGGPFVERIFNEVIFILFLKELLSIAHFISHESDIFSASNTTLSTL